MATPPEDKSDSAPTSDAEFRAPAAWTISFDAGKKRRASKKELQALKLNRERQLKSATPPASPDDTEDTTERPAVHPVVNIDDFVDPAMAIPRSLPTTRADIENRNHFNLLRWYSISRPQYKTSCGISSLTSVWNYLYSRIGQGTLPPVSQEEVMSIVGFQPPFEAIRWGPFTGNVTLMRWFHAINQHFGVTGRAFYLWKAHGSGRTPGVSNDDAKRILFDALRSQYFGIIYHCYNHYFVPIGFLEQPHAPVDAYAPSLKPSESQSCMIIGEVSRGQRPLHSLLWDDIVTDINCQSPHYFNARHPDKGVMTRANATRCQGGNLHCFIGFRSDEAETDLSKYEAAAQEEKDEQEVENDDSTDA